MANEWEQQLDVVADDFVTGLEEADDDDDAAREVIADCIASFYDLREEAEEERGEQAGRFFLVDAVGLDNIDREVPLVRLRESKGSAFADRVKKLFAEVEPEVE